MPNHRHSPARALRAPDTRAESQWRCRRGHLTKARLILTEDSLYRTSAWDMCGRCHEAPSDAQQTRMALDIFGQWLRRGEIDHQAYHKLSHAEVNRNPHLQRRRLEQLTGLARDGRLTPEELKPEDRRLVLRAILGLPQLPPHHLPETPLSTTATHRPMAARRVGRTSEAVLVAQQVASAAVKHAPRLAPPGLHHLAQAAKEAAANALNHSGSGRAIVNLHANSDSVTLTVSDRGCGIPGAMRRNPSLAGEARDHLLLQMATNPAVSSTGDPERGHGLHHLLQCARRNGNRLEIRSGRAHLTLNQEGDLQTRSEPRHRTGTLITLQITTP